VINFVRAFTFKINTNGSGNEDVLPESLTSGQHALFAVWSYSHVPAVGDMVYVKDGGSEVNLELIQPYTRAGNSDRLSFWLLRNAAAGSYVVRSKSLAYGGISGIIFEAKRNFAVQFTTNAAGSGEGTATGLNLISGALSPRFSSAMAFGAMTHNTDGSPNPSDSDLDADTAAGWTLVHKQQDYDGAAQPGASQYKILSSTASVTSRFSIAVATVSYLSQMVIVSEPPAFRLILGGTTGNGVYGQESAGGPDGVDTITLDPPALAGQLIGPVLSSYQYDPDETNLSDDGSNTWAVHAQQSYGGTGNDGSITLFKSRLDNDMSALTYTGPVSGDAGRYGRFFLYVIENPDTVNGWDTATPVTRVEAPATSVDPAGVTPFSPTTDSTFVIVAWANRGHSVEIADPLDIPAEFLAELFYEGTQNSDTASGSAGGTLYESLADYAPVIGFNGTTGSSATVRSLIAGFNVLGGEPGGSVFNGTIGLAASATMTESTDIAFVRAVAMAMASAVTPDGAAAVSRAMNLGTGATMGEDANGESTSSLALPALVSQGTTRTSTAIGTLALGVLANMADGRVVGGYGSLDLAGEADVDLVRQFASYGSIALSVQAATTVGLNRVVSTVLGLASSATLSVGAVRVLLRTLAFDASASLSPASRMLVTLLEQLPASASLTTTTSPEEAPFRPTLDMASVAALGQMMALGSRRAIEIQANVDVAIAQEWAAGRRIAFQIEADISAAVVHHRTGLIALGVDATLAAQAAASFRRQMMMTASAALLMSADPPPLVYVLRVAAVTLSPARIRGVELLGSPIPEGAMEVQPGVTVLGQDKAISEGSTRHIGAQLSDVDGANLTDDASVTSILMTLVDDVSGGIINGRDRLEVKDQNGGTLNESGWFDYQLTPSDTVAIGARTMQLRRMLLEITFDGTDNKENHLIYFYVRNLSGV
jgi:hypothetical protein